MFERLEVANTLYVYMVVPLCFEVPPMFLAAYGTTNRFKKADVLLRWQRVHEIASKAGLKIVGHGTDGYGRCLASMLVIAFQGFPGVTTTITCLKSEYNGMTLFPLIKNGDCPLMNIQDVVHAVIKVKNVLFSAKRKLKMGSCTPSMRDIEKLMDSLGRSSVLELGIRYCDLNANDRQNFDSCCRLCSSKVISKLKELEQTNPEVRGTRIYFEIMRNLIDCFFCKEISLQVKLSKVWTVCVFLRLWRQWCKKTETSVSKHFITLNAYWCVELLAHTVLTAIICFPHMRDEEGNIALIVLSLFGSQACKKYFRAIRSFSTIFSTMINFCVLEFFRRVSRFERNVEFESFAKDMGITWPLHEKHRSNENLYGYSGQDGTHVDIHAALRVAEETAWDWAASLGMTTLDAHAKTQDGCLKRCDKYWLKNPPEDLLQDSICKYKEFDLEQLLADGTCVQNNAGEDEEEDEELCDEEDLEVDLLNSIADNVESSVHRDICSSTRETVRDVIESDETSADLERKEEQLQENMEQEIDLLANEQMSSAVDIEEGELTELRREHQKNERKSKFDPRISVDGKLLHIDTVLGNLTERYVSHHAIKLSNDRLKRVQIKSEFVDRMFGADVSESDSVIRVGDWGCFFFIFTGTGTGKSETYGYEIGRITDIIKDSDKKSVREVPLLNVNGHSFTCYWLSLLRQQAVGNFNSSLNSPPKQSKTKMSKSKKGQKRKGKKKSTAENSAEKKYEYLWQPYTNADMKYYRLNSFITKVNVTLRRNVLNPNGFDSSQEFVDLDCFATSQEEADRVISAYDQYKLDHKRSKKSHDTTTSPMRRQITRSGRVSSKASVMNIQAQ